MENTSSVVARVSNYKIEPVSGERGGGCWARFLMPIKRLIMKVKEWVSSCFCWAKGGKKGGSAPRGEEELSSKARSTARLRALVDNFDSACKRFIDGYGVCARDRELKLYEDVRGAAGQVFQLREEFGEGMVRRLGFEEIFRNVQLHSEQIAKVPKSVAIH